MDFLLQFSKFSKCQIPSVRFKCEFENVKGIELIELGLPILILSFAQLWTKSQKYYSRYMCCKHLTLTDIL